MIGQLAFDLSPLAIGADTPADHYRISSTPPYRIFRGDEPVPCVAGLIPNLACAEAVVRALNSVRP